MVRRKLGDQVVVIVGSSSGIGRATALEFARHRPRLVLAETRGRVPGGILRWQRRPGHRAEANESTRAS
jgi:NAD(P)-dependent dehydrogenase (short-subunit alcohol dehydrogenase family)